jgi:hypothetical protein
MGIGDDFKSFCGNLTVNNRSDISDRYQAITKRLNLDFWNSTSDTDHSRYVGSYGRGTAIRGFSDLDMLFQLRYEDYLRYNSYSGNGQSAQLQDVRNSIKKTYPKTDVGGDGQVVVVEFSDGMKFEVVSCFINKDNSFTYPDSNDGGRWRSTDPLPEIQAVADMDKKCNGNLKELCRMARSWKNEWNVPMGGLLIDTLAHNFLKDWDNKDKGYVYYDWMSRDFFDYLANQNTQQSYWLAIGSSQQIPRKGSFEYKAKQCYNLAVEAIADYEKYTYTARGKWRKIYGTAFPAA